MRWLLIPALLLSACAPLRRVTVVPPPDPAHVCQTNPSYYDPGCCWKMRDGKCVTSRSDDTRSGTLIVLGETDCVPSPLHGIQTRIRVQDGKFTTPLRLHANRVCAMSEIGIDTTVYLVEWRMGSDHWREFWTVNEMEGQSVASVVDSVMPVMP